MMSPSAMTIIEVGTLSSLNPISLASVIDAGMRFSYNEVNLPFMISVYEPDISDYIEEIKEKVSSRKQDKNTDEEVTSVSSGKNGSEASDVFQSLFKTQVQS